MSEYPKLIGLTGYAGSGKDLVAAFLGMVGYTRFGFADAVRQEVEASKDYPPCMPDHILQDWIAFNCEPEGAIWRKPLSPEGRRVLQWWGTEYRRKEDPDYWIKKISMDLVFRKPSVISDVRFLNEANWIERWEGVIWRVERPGLKSDGHQSESECNFIKADYTINNDGDLQHLKDQVCTALEVFRDGSETTKSACD